MKDKYRYIHFIQLEQSFWMCRNTKHDSTLGFVEYCPQWKRFVFLPESNTQFSIECMIDIIDFIKQLKTE